MMNDFLQTIPARNRRWGVALSMAFAGLLLSGCATGKPERNAMITSLDPDALPMTVGFVYEEDLHSAGKDFTTEDCFWDHVFPEVARVFREARMFPTRWEALQSDVELVVLGESIVYGEADHFKYSLSLRAMTLKEHTVLRESVQQKTLSLDDCEESFTGMGHVLYKALATSARMRKFVEKKDEPKLDSERDRSKSPWAK